MCLPKRNNSQKCKCSQATFPAECIDDIFRHLSGRFLIKCTEVCPEWNEFISSSTWCMQRIQMRIYSWQDYIENVEILYEVLTNTNRKYVNLDLMGDFDTSMRIVLSARKIRWKNVCSWLRFRSIDRFYEFLQIIQHSVEKLELRDGITRKYENLDFDSSKLKFP